MRQEPVKAYGNLHPADGRALQALEAVFDSWGLTVELELAGSNGDLLRLGFEGVFFLYYDAVEAIRPFLTPASTGKLDILNFEDWTLTRYTFDAGRLCRGQRDLNQVLEYSGH